MHFFSHLIFTRFIYLQIIFRNKLFSSFFFLKIHSSFHYFHTIFTDVLFIFTSDSFAHDSLIFTWLIHDSFHFILFFFFAQLVFFRGSFRHDSLIYKCFKYLHKINVFMFDLFIFLRDSYTFIYFHMYSFFFFTRFTYFHITLYM